MKNFAVLLTLLQSLVVAFVAASSANNALGPYKVSDVTVSGLSSGGYMAVQVHVAFSSIVNGSAIYAGGPFYCAQGNIMTAEYKCMATYEGTPNIPNLVSVTNSWASSGKIDKPSNMKDDNIYLFSGSGDTVVHPEVMHSLETYYTEYVSSSQILSNFNLKSEHCIPTLSFGEECATLGSPYIGKCNFDGAGVGLKQIYGTLAPSVTAVSSNLMSFSQTPYITSTGTSLADTGYIYVPTACQKGETCHLHVAFHGCEQTQDLIGNEYASKTGFNEWAEANHIIVLYPYAKRSMSMPSNPNGCWDWWGYTNKDYSIQAGVQMQFVRSLIKAVSGV